MPLRIVHVSDIHFHTEKHGWDANQDQRRELIADLDQIVVRDGPVNAVLVGGDIAFQADPEEYDIAHRWLLDVVKVCGGIDESAVWTVPGNHDVSWSVLDDCVGAQDFRNHLRACPPEAVDELLRTRMSADPAASGLFIPFESYNKFASHFLCETSPKQPHWFDETTLEVDGWPVRLTGLNSALTSDWDDHKLQESVTDGTAHSHDVPQTRDEDSAPAKGPALVLGTEQCRLPREGDPIHVVMAHHPPAWIRDWSVVGPYMRRGHLWLFGHEHAYSASQDVPLGSVQLAAGAVGPERDEGGEQEPFVPAYSVITLNRTPHHTLMIHVLPRYWSLAATRYVDHPSGDRTFEVARDPAIAHGPGADQSNAAGDRALDHEGAQGVSASAASPLAAEPEGVDSAAVPHTTRELTVEVARPDLRRIATQFMAKPATHRVRIGLELGVIEDGDLDTERRSQLFRLILRRVRDQGLIDELAEKLRNSK